MSIKSNDLIFLIGAGCSVEASIPASGVMIDRIEDLLKNDPDWISYEKLYYHLKSAIYYSAGLHGVFKDAVPYNIETLANTLYELERNENHPLYPFIAAWNSRFVLLAGAAFENISAFRRLILKQLKAWVLLEGPEAADYYAGFKVLQRQLNFPLKIFSLNYDLCIEYFESSDFRVELGFPGVGLNKPWDYLRFHDSQAEHINPSVYLYKLHGSINWKRDANQSVVRLAHTENIKPEEMEVIFGRDFKLEAADPYLFFAYEFRRWTLEARLIVCVGYGFGDGHINKMLSQALRDDVGRRIMIVAKCDTEDLRDKKAAEIVVKLEVLAEQVIVESDTAKSFLTRTDLPEVIEKNLPEMPDLPF